ncbi:hypothetical protein ACTQ33_01145 [Candidatus Avoscillospira sp. LCP25S3_F1]|uniref:hypothetical protein n=1 Tax=Candidatus Avoscillospira sp. LCP25S3_F1 TaxID=3438825 RepID=UPI003F8F2000
MEEKRELTVEEKLDLLISAIESDREDRRKEKSERRGLTRLCVICATIVVVATLCVGGLIFALANGLTIETTHQTVEGDTAEINNNNDGGKRNFSMSKQKWLRHESNRNKVIFYA